MITILVASHNTSSFVEILLKSIDKFTENNVKVLIGDNSSDENEFMRLERITSDYSYVQLFNTPNVCWGSLNHGIALHYLFKKVKTKFVSLIDSDIVLLKQGWDTLFLDFLDSKTKAVGFKPRLILLSLFEKQVAKGVDFRPRGLLDTAWNLSYIIEQKYKVKYFKETHHPLKGEPFYKIKCVNLYYNGEVIANHFSRGSSMGEAKYVKHFKIPFAKNIIRRYQGQKEFEKWRKEAWRRLNV